MKNSIKTILFDLDGTLLDTAPDFIFALNTLLAAKNREPLAAEIIRNAVSFGTAKLIEIAFELPAETALAKSLRQELLEIYSENLTRFTKPFDGIHEVLQILARLKINWGVVTNKPAWLTQPLMASMNFTPEPGVVISGDTFNHAKPHPEPLLKACEQLSSDISQCLFIGDSLVDVQAGKSAGITTLVAEYGYIGDLALAYAWQADAYIASPIGLLNYLPLEN